MAISVFDLFKVGIGPSSSHTVGPMRAAYLFCQQLKHRDILKQTATIKTDLFGSLGHTGKGHGTDKAIILGLSGYQPDAIDPDIIDGILNQVNKQQSIEISAQLKIAFNYKKHLKFHKRKTLPLHSNGMRFVAYDGDDNELLSKDFYSVGGGFIISHNKLAQKEIVEDATNLPFPFKSGEQLLALCQTNKMTIAEIMYANEKTWFNKRSINKQLDNLWQVFKACVERGLNSPGELPGGLKVKRRAPELFQSLRNKPQAALRDPLTILDWVNLYALAVSEENAAGGRVVTAPTNGAAGIIPAVLHYYYHFCPEANIQGIRNFILTAGAVGMLYKENASISGAEVGCQGEVGVACSMAAAGLAAACNESPEHIENAAEIAMEHNLGLTCDPIGGLVQIPCIERNAMGAVKAINAFRLASRGDGSHWVSLDKVIKTMKITGQDMQSKYKETSRGGLAVNIIEC
ncbi:MAG: L-serine ammonia-lyase [Alcanivoracaceae bacterium]|nr:L-serine ammonia-lyase [Alcanivoracaceae bacterium]